jgi:ribosomal protein L7/L12
VKSLHIRARRWLLGFGAFLLCIAVVAAVSTLSWPVAAVVLVLFVGIFLCLKAFRIRAAGTLNVDQSAGFHSVRLHPGEYTVSLTSTGPRKIEIIRRVRSVNSTSLREAKALVDNLPALLVSGIDESEASRLAVELRTAGAEVSVTRQGS